MPATADLLDEAIDLARADAVYVGLLNDGHEHALERSRGSRKLGK
jgi:hypothetical protein